MSMIPISKIYAQSSIQERFDEFRLSVEGDPNFVTFVNSIIKFLVPLAVFSAGILLSFAAFKMISSKGDPEALKDAREQIGNAVTGLIFIILSGAILVLISNIILNGTG
ncbi:MAG TPA: hypothetical protein P5059_00410 [Candidatus Dojkabacteria bacterium]|nr:hypothetical protein [Candidatus Dojkabacteria bacterium]